MILNTMAEGMSLARKLETESGSYYEALAKKYYQSAEPLLNFAKENKKNITNVESTYYGVITDALEGCFALNLDTAKYTINTALSDNASFKAAIDQALENENKIIQFYTDSASQAESLMADVPRVFKVIAKKRIERIAKIKSL